tara:strand:+ start:2536 stop:2937 length:402 start_codon:yes stop_codon:yes gene_type:complete
MAINTETVWWVERDELALANKSGDQYTGPDASKTVYIYCTRADLPFTKAMANNVSPASQIGINDSPSIPEDFHEALINYVLWKGYEKKIAQDVNMLKAAAHFETRWTNMVRDGKKVAKVGRDGSSHSIAQYEY